MARPRRLRSLFVSIAAGWFGLAVAGLASPLLACGIGNGQRLDVAMAGLNGHGDIVLADRSLARLAGIRLFYPTSGESGPLPAGFELILRSWRQHDVVLAVAGAAPDRWGRQSISVTRAGSDDNLALDLVRNGLAMTWTTELPPNCRNQFLQAEEVARKAGRGRWVDMQFRALDAANGADVAARAGQVAVMSGRVNHVGQTRRAAYLNFGVRGTGASAELALSNWRLMERQGWTRDGMKGKIVRVRGIVMEGRPARLLLDDVSAIEFLN